MEWREVKISETTTKWFANGFEVSEIRFGSGRIRRMLTRIPIESTDNPNHSVESFQELAERLQAVLDAPQEPSDDTPIQKINDALFFSDKPADDPWRLGMVQARKIVERCGAAPQVEPPKGEFQIGRRATSADGRLYEIRAFDRHGDTVEVRWREVPASLGDANG